MKTNQAINKKRKQSIFQEIWQSLSFNKRSERFSYFFYSIILPILCLWIFAALAGLIGKIPSAGHASQIIAYVFLALGFVVAIYVFMKLTIQRCHDFNAKGWLAPLVLIPFAYLLFCLIPGTTGANNFGSQPPAPSRGMKIAVLILIAAIVSAITYILLSYCCS